MSRLSLIQVLHATKLSTNLDVVLVLANLSLILWIKGILGHQFCGHIGAQKPRRMVVGILAQLDASIELGDGSRRALVLVQPLAIPVGADPVDRGPETGLLLVHVAIEHQVEALFLVPQEEVFVFVDPLAPRNIPDELTCNRGGKAAGFITRTSWKRTYNPEKNTWSFGVLSNPFIAGNSRYSLLFIAAYLYRLGEGLSFGAIRRLIFCYFTIRFTSFIGAKFFVWHQGRLTWCSKHFTL